MNRHKAKKGRAGFIDVGRSCSMKLGRRVVDGEIFGGHEYCPSRCTRGVGETILNNQEGSITAKGKRSTAK